jgi:hypothetical protein
MKSSNALNSSSSQYSLSLSKVLAEQLTKLETGHASVEPKKHSMVRRKTPVDSQKGQFKPSFKPPDCSPPFLTISEATTPSAKDPVRTSQSLADGNEHFGSDVIALETMLSDRLRLLAKDGDQVDTFDKQLQLINSVFQQVIDKDKRFSSLLLKIKAFYDTWLKTFAEQSSDRLLSHCSEQLKLAKKKLQQAQEDKKSQQRKVEKLSREALELGRKLEECEEDYALLRGKWEELSTVDLEDMVLDEKTWKYLVVENQGYHELFKKMQGEFKAAKEEENRLQGLIQRMKDKGFPMDELEDRSEEAENEDDLELIASGPEKKMLKPKIVPRLRLDALLCSSNLDLSP